MKAGTGEAMEETLWRTAARWSGLASPRFVRALDMVAALRELAEREGQAGLERIEFMLGGGEVVPANPILHVAPDVVSPLDALLQARLRLFQVARDSDGRRILFKNWSDFHLYARYAAMPIGRDLFAGAIDESGGRAIDTLMTASLLVAQGIDAPTVWRRERRLLIPMDWLAKAGATADAIGAERASAGVRGAYVALSRRALELTAQANVPLRALPAGPARRYAAVLLTLTRRLAERLSRRDALAARQLPSLGDRIWCQLIR